MSLKKKAIRKAFRDACYQRDRYCCACCGHASTPDKAEEELDAHHITPREIMPNGGYVAENGISLCERCHLEAEAYLSGETSHPDFSPQHLYGLVDSSLESARRASEALQEP